MMCSEFSKLLGLKTGKYEWLSSALDYFVIVGTVGWACGKVNGLSVGREGRRECVCVYVHVHAAATAAAYYYSLSLTWGVWTWFCQLVLFYSILSQKYRFYRKSDF